MAITKIHIALLDCDTPVPLVLAKKGMYSDIFRELILATAAKRNEKREFTATMRWEFSTYHCVKGELPSEEEMKNVDGVVITGSASSAYDKDVWIQNLNLWTKNTYRNHPHALLFGSCFGHQLIAQALFAPLPPATSVVTGSPHGWELGIQPITLSPRFTSHFGPVTSTTGTQTAPNVLKMQFVHADHLSPTAIPILPSGFMSIGSSARCQIQGVWQQNRVLTYQGHIEFNEFVNRETIRVFGTLCGWREEDMRKALESTCGEDDSIWATKCLVRFFEEGVLSRGEERGGKLANTETVVDVAMDEKAMLGKEMGAKILEVAEAVVGA